MKRRLSKALLCIVLAISVLTCVFAVVAAAGEPERDYKVKTSITLWTNITYNLYAEDSEDLKALALDGEELTLTSLGKKTIGDKDYYHIKIELPANEVLRDIALKVTLTDGEEDSTLTYTFNIYNLFKGVYFKT